MRRERRLAPPSKAPHKPELDNSLWRIQVIRTDETGKQPCHVQQFSTSIAPSGTDMLYEHATPAHIADDLLCWPPAEELLC
ncbi:hypothetical protein D9M68_796240 [compost metagenome]